MPAASRVPGEVCRLNPRSITRELGNMGTGVFFLELPRPKALSLVVA